jgi:hypothetical protein
MPMISSEVQRTLVKSPPELWSELSDPDALARHLGELGEIKITRTEPEKLVEWEAEGTTGTVAIKASGWGTKVTLTVHHEPPARAAAAPAVAAPEDEDAPDASAEAQDDAQQQTSGDEPATIAQQPPAEAVSADPKPAPATEAARRAAGWPDARGHAGPAIESDLRAAEADAPISDHAPWHLEAAAHTLQAGSAAELQPETEPAPQESRRGFFARLFGSRRKRSNAAATEAREPADHATDQPQVTQPVADVPEPATVSQPEVVTDTDAALDTLADTSAPEAPAEVTEPVAIAEPQPDDSAAVDAKAEGAEAETTPDPEPATTAESVDLAAELKAAEEIAAEQVKAVLTGVLDRLGAAHHRPFSRA